MSDDKKVVSLSEAREERKPWVEGEARCLACKHEWVAVAPSGTLWLVCPSCSLERGRFIYPFYRKDEHWMCGCENDLFLVTREGVYCPNCGCWQQFPKE